MTTKEERLKKRFIELSQRSYQRGTYTYTDFLSTAEQSILLSMRLSLSSAPFVLFGGAALCERQMARFGLESDCSAPPPFPIACLEIIPRNSKFADILTHRDFLGALMNLGVERSTLGDILVRDNMGYLFCTDTMAPFLQDNLSQVSRTPVYCRPAADPPQEAAVALLPQRVQVSSPRADALVARAYQLSRQDSLLLFQSQKVLINGIPCTDNSRTLDPDDLISVRGYGRFLYRGEAGQSRKGKLVAIIEKYQ